MLDRAHELAANRATEAAASDAANSSNACAGHYPRCNHRPPKKPQPGDGIATDQNAQLSCAVKITTGTKHERSQDVYAHVQSTVQRIAKRMAARKLNEKSPRVRPVRLS